MPRKNKRKFFFGKSKKSKSAKLENQNVTTELENQQQSDSEEEEDNNATEKGEREKARSGNLQKSAVHASISSVTNDSASELGGQFDANSQLSLAEVNAFKMGTATSSRWRSEPILNVLEKENRKATITLKIIQFIPKAEAASEGGKINNEDTQKIIDNTRCVYDDTDHHKSKTIKDDTVISVEIAEQIQPSSVLHVDNDCAVGEVPKLDHAKEEKRRRHFDDNYRVESPKQYQATLQSEENRNKRRHAMLIQEISESSSSEEVKQFLDAEASALEMKSEIVAVPAKIYRVDSPESSSNDDEVNRCKQSSLVQEICESSSNESVKNEILASLSKLSPTPSQVIEPGKVVTLKIINIKELPTDDLTFSPTPKTPTSPIMKNKPIEKKLNKAEEAIMEALYGNPNLLQIPNTPLDVISEEGSDCSDIERHSKINQLDIDDDEVFLPSATRTKSVESASSSKFKHRRRVMTANSTPPVEQPTMLINTKIIEAESNVQESCKTWETKAGDSELQAELVYLPSTSSSATDLSERSGDITDPEDTTASEDTETNSLLENISVPSLYGPSVQYNTFNNDHVLQKACELYIDSEQNQLPLPDILEESDDLSQKSLELIESQQQIIEDVNKALHHLVSTDEHVEVERKKKNERKEESMNEEIEVSTSVTETVQEEDSRKDENETQIITQQQKVEPNVIVCDKKQTTTTDNEPQTRQISSNSGTPTQFRRKYSSDSSSSSANSQCTIIRQTVPIDNSCVHPLRDLCMQSLQSGLDNNNNSNNNIINGSEAKITVQKKFNSISRNAPNIPIINELELHYNDDDRRSRENQRDKVITILQVPPDIKSSSEMNQMSEKTRWYGLPSTQVPNLMLALSPLQKDYIASSPDSQQTTKSVDVLLDMHKKFVERRAYHEKSDDENSDTSRLAKVLKQENEYRSDDNNQSGEDGEKVCDVEMKIARDSPQKSANKGEFEVKRNELENELKLLDIERQELEEELKNLQSLQHFKQEEYIYAQNKVENDLQSVGSKVEEEVSESQSVEQNYANDDFSEFINSNEKLHQEIYNEWQDKVYQRNERKLQKTLKITSVNDAATSSSCDDAHSERAASEKYVPLRDEFISKVKERQKRLSLPIDDTRNWDGSNDGSTESLLDDEKTGIRKKKKKVFHVESNNKENFPAHFREFLDYCEQEIAQSKNSVESGKSMNTLPLLGLIGVASLCICGFFIWKNSSKFSP